jgi:tripartite-type tricarboxylate transporter receptor subunit TctC
MKLSRHQFLHLAAGAAALPTVSRIAAAQTYPTRPITMIVPFAAGGTTDVIGRVLAARMRDSLKQSVIMENVSGADGRIGTGRAARARPDGYTIGESPRLCRGIFTRAAQSRELGSPWSAPTPAARTFRKSATA